MDDIRLMLSQRGGPPMLRDPGDYHESALPPNDRKLFAILREWRILVICVVATMIAGVVFLVMAPRHYTASAVVMAAPRQPDLSRTDSVLNGTPTPEPQIVRDPDIEGEVEIMSSPATLQHVVEDLDLAGASNKEITNSPSVYDLLKDVRVLTGLEQADPAHPVSLAGLYHQVLAKFRIGRPELPDQGPDIARRTELATEMLARNLKVAPIGRSTMVKIDFTSNDPRTAAKVASAIAMHYIDARNQIRVDAANQASDWLRDHTAELRANLVDAETRLAQFRARMRIDGRDPLQLEGDMKALGDRIVAAKADQAKAAMRLSVAEDRVRREGPLGLLSWDAGPGADEFLTQSRAIADMRRDAAKMSTTVGAFNPNVARLEAEAKTLETKMNSEAQTKLANLRMSSDAAAKEVASLEKGLQGMRVDYDRLEAASVQLTALQQAAAAARTVYENFETRWKMTEQTGFNEAAGWLVSPASAPIRPSSPSIPLVLIASMVAGLGLGLSGALWKEYRGSRTLRSSEDVERLLPGVRSLGLLPELSTRCRSAREVVAATGTGSDPEFEEAVGTVWTAITQAAEQENPATRGQVVLVSSALPREGKSASAGIIACAAAAAGQRVVVIDCDLRLPAMGHAFGVAGHPGLVECVDGTTDHHMALAINRIKRVFVLPSGRTAHAPQQLLRSPRFAALLSDLRNEFDWIVVDSPPVLGLSDARLLTKMADHTILVATWSQTRRKVVAMALQTLARNGGRIAGVILSRTNMRRVASFGYDEAAAYGGQYRDYYRSYYNWRGKAAKAAPWIEGPVA